MASRLGNVAFDYLDDAGHLDPEVLMRDQVAQPRDAGPGNLGGAAAGLVGEILDGLPEDDELEQQRVAQHRILVSGALLACTRHVALDGSERVTDVLEALPLVAGHSG